MKKSKLLIQNRLMMILEAVYQNCILRTVPERELAGGRVVNLFSVTGSVFEA